MTAFLYTSAANKQAAPQTHRKRARRTRFARLRRSSQLRAFVQQQATRLSLSASAILTRLATQSDVEIRNENS